MRRIPGYQIHEHIYESLNSSVYRGQRESDGQAVILKVLKEDYPTPEERFRYQQEYEITCSLKLDGVIKAYSLEKYQNTLVMVLEDFGGLSLQSVLTEHRFSLKDCLTIAIQIAESLAQIHAANIIHKDINPSNIVLNVTTGQLKLIDFGIATKLSRENPIIRHPNVLEGTLVYMSPEQTGRMNRSLDYRTDFYSLGVTLYELLTGQLPFESEDALELVHCHLAKMPTPPCELGPSSGVQNLDFVEPTPGPSQEGIGEIEDFAVKASFDTPDGGIEDSAAKLRFCTPQVLSDIVMKLMAKTAEERYQSAVGLKADLQRCLDSLNLTGTIEPFDIGQHDVSGRFQIPEKLYGREQETQTLLQAFERVSTGSAELLLVTGEAGVGKSSLVHEVHKPITEKRGSFIAGKFDQFQRDVPYSAFIQVFQAFVSLLLTEEEETLAAWKTHILNAVGNLGKVLTGVIPNVELVIGDQPEIPELGPTQAQNRFNLVFGNFVKAIARQEHPLALVIDDLQWADSASLSLLKVLMSDPEIQYLLLIGAYREHELGPSHPLTLTLEELQQEQANISTIRLHNLSLEHVTDLIGETLLHPEGVERLASLVYEKTQGNAFFVKQLFQALYDDQLLEFKYPPQSPLKEGSQEGWYWDMAAIQQVGMTDNVVELMAAKVQKLPTTSQQIVTLAACIGNRFDLDTLAIIAERTPHDTAQTLHPALVEGLVMETGNSKFEIRNLDTESPISNFQFPVSNFKFAHDRIQEAAYSLIPEKEKAPVHLNIGRVLREKIPQDQQEERIFEIVSQFNAGRSLLEQPENLIMLAELNLQAGRKAKASTAYHPALKHFEIGIELLPEESWESHHTLTFALYRECYECEYLTAHFDEAERLFAFILEHTTSKWERAEIYNIGIEQYAMMGKYEEAIEIGREALKLFGMELPEHDLQTATKQELAAIQINLGGQTIADLLHLPLMTDPEQKEIIKLLLSLGPPTYQSHHLDLCKFTRARMINIVLNYGTTQETPVCYVNYGTMLRNYFGEYQAGYEFGKVGIQLSETFKNAAQQCRTLHQFAKYVNPWRMPLKTSVPLEKQAFRYALESGELMTTGYAFGGLIEALLLKGDELGRVLAELDHAIQFVSKTKSKVKIYLFAVYRQFILCLQGRTRDTQTFNDHNFDEVRFLEDVKELPIQICRFSICKLQSFYTYEHHTEALSMAREAETRLASIFGMVQAAEQNFYYSLTLCALYPTANEAEQQCYREKLRANQQQMKIWADNCPENFLHKYLLVEAEIARTEGRKWDAVECYRQAIEEARTNEFIQHEALGNELLAKFWLAQGDEKIAQVYMTDAHYGYQLWGATGKVQDLEQKYSQLLATRPEKTGHLDSRTTTPLPLTGSRSDDLLDFTTVMKASHTIAGEIVLDSLLSKMMTIVIENAGAQKGYLMLEESGHWVIEAEGAIDTTDVKVLHSMSIEQSEDVSAQIIRYVAHTQDSVVLHDAANEGNFTHDPQIVTKKPKSIVCLPLLHRGNLSGILYLENNLTVGAFTPKRLEVLDVLSSQMAISLENAILYNNLDQKVKERTFLLEEQTARFRKLSEATFEGILIHDKGRILEVNQTLEQMFGYQRSEILGRNVLDFVAPASRDVVLQHIQAGDECLYEAQAIRKDGAIFPIEVQAKRMPYQGRNVRVAAVRDLSWWRRMEAEKAQLQQENITLRSTMKERYKFGEIVGKSAAMQEVYELIAHASATDANVVIYGESGTGKELIAHTIHQLSERREQTFVPVNCGAIHEDLFESEFFGHRKGAFTGADRNKQGFFDVAHKGTLFLDEVGELSPMMQVKLLRALQSGEYIPVGENTPRHADVRIIAATNKNLAGQLRKGVIRKDFFYRINVVTIMLPPLRERREDIPLLVDYFLEHDKADSGLSEAGKPRLTLPGNILASLYRYDWPGNIRELQNVLQRYVTIGRLDLTSTGIADSALREAIPDAEIEQKGLGLQEALEALEKRLVIRTLEQHHWHRGKTAATLGIPRRSLQRKMKKYGLILMQLKFRNVYCTFYKKSSCMLST